MQYATEPKCSYCDSCMSEYCGCKLGRIKEIEPTCDSTAVIPSITVESVEGITNLANCLVHVNDINTTFYVDDKHRVMITWAGPVDIPGYDMENNPEGFRDQIVTDKEKNIAVIYDKHGKGYTFGIEQGYDIDTIIGDKLTEMVEDGTLVPLLEVYVAPYVKEQIEGEINPRLDSQDATLAEQDEKIFKINQTVDVHTSQIANLVSENNPTEGNTELIDIRVAENGYVYASAGNSVRNQVSDCKMLTKVAMESLKQPWNEFPLNLSADLFEVGGINSSTGTNVDESTQIIRTRDYLKFDEVFRYLRIIGHTEEVHNIIVYIYEEDNSFDYAIRLQQIQYFEHLSPTKKYRLALVDDAVVASIPTTLAKFDLSIVSYFKPNDDIYHIDEMNLINPNYAIADALVDLTTGYVVYSSGTYSSICVPCEGDTQYYADHPNYYTAFFDADMNLIGNVHYTNDNPLSSPFTTPANARYIAKTFKTAEVGTSAFISKTNGYYPYGDVVLTVKNNVHNKPVTEGDVVHNVLYQKTIDLFGDSITSTDYTLPYWGDIIATNTGCTVNNYGISGTTLAHTDDRHLWDYHFARLDAEEIGYVPSNPATWSTGNCFCERFTKVDSTADAVVIMGGTNDNNVPLGTWDSTATDTFYGALNTLLIGICNHMPAKKVLVCTPMQKANGYPTNVLDPLNELRSKSSSSTLTMQLRAEAIKEKCNQYGIPCLDLYNGSGISGIDAQKVYYRSNDNLHPSSYGQLRLASLIQSALEDLFRD